MKLLVIVLMIVSGAAFGAEPVGGSREIETQYFSISAEDTGYREEPVFDQLGRFRPASGPILAKINHESLAIVNQAGRVSVYNVAQNRNEKNSYPRLKTGLMDFPHTHHYLYIETGPRILGAVVNSNRLYVAYHFYDKDKDDIFFRISSMELSEGQWRDEWTSGAIDVAYYSLGSGGRMAVLKGQLFVTVGDQSLDRKNGTPTDFAAQNPKLPWGKVIYFRFGEHGRLAQFNVCSIGHRNPSGIVVGKDDVIYITEHGPRGGDSLGRIRCGMNYGWPYFSYGTKYTAYGTYSALGKPPNYQEPVYYFTPSVALSAVAEIHGFASEWIGNLLLGSLKAQSLFRVRIQANGSVQNIEQIDIGERIRDIAEFNQAIILSTDSNAIIKLRVSDAPLYKFDADKVERCVLCHEFSNDRKGAGLYGPSLFKVYGRPIAALDYPYSPGLQKNRGKFWGDKELRAFLANPSKFAPGTKMPNVNLKESDIDDIMDALKNEKSWMSWLGSFGH